MERAKPRACRWPRDGLNPPTNVVATAEVPTVSILMPVFNGARYLIPAVQSVLDQTLDHLELIAVDDGSTDSSLAILSAFARQDGRIRVLSRPNTGIVGALTDAASIARAPYIARLDADDVAEARRFERQIAYMSGNPDCVALGSGAWIIDSDGDVVDRYVPPCSHSDIERNLLMGNGAALLHPSAVFRRDVFEAVGGYDPAFCRAEDIDLYFRLIPEGRLSNLPDSLIKYRQHAASTNFTSRALQRELVHRILERESVIRQIPVDSLALAPAPADRSTAELHRQWACTSCRYGRPGTALKHGILALRESPLDPESWRILRYVATRMWHRMRGGETESGKEQRPLS